MTWLMEILKIYLKEQLQTKHYMKKRLILQKLQNMVDNGLYFFFFFFFENSGVVAENKELAKELHKPMIKKV